MNRDLEQYRDIAIKSLAVLGLMTILALGSFLTLTVLSYIPKLVRSAAHYVASTTPELNLGVADIVKGKGSLGLTSDKDAVSSGSRITLSWTKSSAEANGSYSLSYSCVSGVSVSYKGTPLNCNVPFPVDQDAENMTLSLSSKKLREANVAFTLRFTENGAERASRSDSVKVSVTNNAIASEDKTTSAAPVFSIIGSYVAGTPSYTGIAVSSNNTSSEWGQADLRPVILEMGVIDPVTKMIIPAKVMSRTSKAGVRFVVENIGTKTSAPWVFNAVLPTSPRYTYLPEFQPPLKPGERIEYTLTFDRIVEDNNTITITVDPAETLPEATKANNKATISFTAF